jgi:glyoxylase-like metal-dependent hydrolase (beta-lactamase superfamily II)
MLKIQSFVFSPIQENTYVIYNESGKCIIIDPGCYFDEEKETLVGFINEHKLQPRVLLNTHCHLDHVFGNKFLAATFDLPLHIHEKEKPVLEFAPASGLMWNMPFDNYTGELIYLQEGDKIMLDDDQLEVLNTPGHSPGSISFYCAAQGFVISGDVLFRRGIGRTDLPGGDFEVLASSIRKKLYQLPDVVEVYSGHGPVTNIGEEKRANPHVSAQD